LACNRASFVTDVTIPDNTGIAFDQPFTKTWRLKNVGSCTWDSGYQVVFDSGEQMGGPASQQLTDGTVAPEETIDVSLDLRAPSIPGTYKGYWKLREPGGDFFALSTGPFWVQIRAQAPAAALPAWPIRQTGDSGTEVSALQYLLAAHGEVLTVDGFYGPITMLRVQHFQDQNGLTADGVVGPLTWVQLIVQVKQGSDNDAVRAVQLLLRRKLGSNLATDGIFGPQTDAAVRNWQAAKGLRVDGIVGPPTWQSLVGS
jgi:peptidoglycan hydrolase-like protein with peptidoglycan-binding domain